jgi:hypothetical protein
MLRFLVCRISWVHRDDLVSLIMESLSNPAYEGNLVFFFFAQFNRQVHVQPWLGI